MCKAHHVETQTFQYLSLYHSNTLVIDDSGGEISLIYSQSWGWMSLRGQWVHEGERVRDTERERKEERKTTDIKDGETDGR